MIKETIERFKDRPLEDRTKYVQAVEYLQKMAHLSGTPLVGVDIFAMLSDGKSGLIGSKPEINRRLFNLSQAETKAEWTDVEKTTLRSWNQMMITQQQADMVGIENDRVQNLSNCQRYMARAQDELTNAWQKELRLQALKGRTYDLAEQLERIRGMSFYSLSGVNRTDNCIDWVTRNDVVLSEKNPAAGIDRTVNLGTYVIRFKPDRAKLYVMRGERNVVTSSGHYHPYVASDASICWGTASDAARTALSTGDIAGAMDLLSAILSHYSPDATPYASLDRFARATSSSSPPACQWCNWLPDGEESNCNTHWCYVCAHPRRYPEECCCASCERPTDDCSCNSEPEESPF